MIVRATPQPCITRTRVQPNAAYQALCVFLFRTRADTVTPHEHTSKRSNCTADRDALTP